MAPLCPPLLFHFFSASSTLFQNYSCNHTYVFPESHSLLWICPLEANNINTVISEMWFVNLSLEYVLRLVRMVNLQHASFSSSRFWQSSIPSHRNDFGIHFSEYLHQCSSFSQAEKWNLCNMISERWSVLHKLLPWCSTPLLILYRKPIVLNWYEKPVEN